MSIRDPRVEANRLYWQTDTSVAEIAEQLGVSRRALYELVTPENAGVNCSNCGAEVVYVNRSAKAAGIARCPSCGSETEVGADDTDVQESIPPYAAGWPRARATEDHEMRSRAFKIGGAALAGAAFGVMAALLIVRRR